MPAFIGLRWVRVGEEMAWDGRVLIVCTCVVLVGRDDWVLGRLGWLCVAGIVFMDSDMGSRGGFERSWMELTA